MVNCRNEIGETFADPRRSLHAEIGVFLERLRNRECHMLLLNTALVRAPSIRGRVPERRILRKECARVMQAAALDFLEKAFLMFRDFDHFPLPSRISDERGKIARKSRFFKRFLQETAKSFFIASVRRLFIRPSPGFSGRSGTVREAAAREALRQRRRPACLPGCR